MIKLFIILQQFGGDLTQYTIDWLKQYNKLKLTGTNEINNKYFL